MLENAKYNQKPFVRSWSDNIVFFFVWLHYAFTRLVRFARGADPTESVTDDEIHTQITFSNFPLDRLIR